MNTSLTAQSSNQKTGPIAVSTTARQSCPSTCPLAGDGGCYAEAGYYTRMHWDAVSAGKRGLSPETFIAALQRLRSTKLFRHNVAGDLWHVAGVIQQDLVLQLADACKRLRGAWTYTHHLRTPQNVATVHEATARGLTVNLSCESRSEAARLHKQGLPAVCIVPEDTAACFTHDGVKFRQCPATFDKSHTQCATCGAGKPICARAERDFVVTFPVHGGRKSKAAVSCS